MIYDYLQTALGKPKNFYPDIKTLEYNCPKCAEEEGVDCDNKHNLNITLTANKHIFHCWKCNYKGKVKYLLQRHGKLEDYKAYMDYHLEELDITSEKKKVYSINLPKEFISFKNVDLNNPTHKLAYDYVTIIRAINIKTINYFKIGFCTEGYYKGKIIIPSYNKYNKLNWFATRCFDESSQSHLNPGGDKESIIFNESNINFNHPVYLVEGSFDMCTLPINTIVLLGKKIHNLLLDKLIKYQTPVIIILDPDAENDAKEIEEELKLFGTNYVKTITGLPMDLNEMKQNNIDIIKYLL